ncbi:hypothetical protein CDAR_258391, partial [Caerostris darwini]
VGQKGPNDSSQTGDYGLRSTTLPGLNSCNSPPTFSFFHAAGRNRDCLTACHAPAHQARHDGAAALAEPTYRPATRKENDPTQRGEKVVRTVFCRVSAVTAKSPCSVPFLTVLDLTSKTCPCQHRKFSTGTLCGPTLLEGQPILDVADVEHMVKRLAVEALNGREENARPAHTSRYAQKSSAR